MLRKATILATALAGGIGLSQYPEFAQQYLQRLGGQVDALGAVVRDFDATAARNQMTREEALHQMQGTPFLQDRQKDLRRSFLRHARLSDDLVALRGADPFERIWMPQRLADGETFAATWADFVPAVPMTSAGAAAAGLGALGGAGLGFGLWRLFAWPFRRRYAS